ncbi:MAG: endonuclease/exonuclease/phosphatase family protein [Rikenellaceae bacterium]
MKRTLLTLVAILSLTTTTKAQEADSIRIMSYNIWNGFTEAQNKRDLFIDFITAKDPEILGYQELCTFKQADLEALAQEIGHPYAIICKEGGYPVGISSKEPITLIEKRIDGYGHGMLHVQTYGLDVIVTHLNPHKASERQKQVKNITDYMQDAGLSDNVVVMGDMNAHSPMDADQLELTAKTHPERTRGGLGDDNYDYSVIAKYLAYPLIDVYPKYVEAAYRETYPTLVFSTTEAERTRRYTNRIDFLLIAPNLEEAVYNATIHNHGRADYISDHYPISIDMVLKK